MKIPQRKVQPAKGKMEPKPKRKEAKAMVAVTGEAEAFTALELEAAEQLIRLSESVVSFGTPCVLPVAPCVASLGRYSPPMLPAPGTTIVGVSEDWEEDEEHEVAGRQRRVKRYRLISEIYAATEPIDGRSGSNQKKKKE
ncbi:hypothetical protein ZWY2020_036699 [Hordeum vulgare]|uniref:Uncharacterized protein n=1 Tax=Hordeum vulgare subsp. vulgare TaxID=112509 RepID=A0A8I6XIT7_HORVV|nr:hypothetical protein ZWY2020_036699 [Hordeum vulgare]